MAVADADAADAADACVCSEPECALRGTATREGGGGLMAGTIGEGFRRGPPAPDAGDAPTTVDSFGDGGVALTARAAVAAVKATPGATPGDRGEGPAECVPLGDMATDGALGTPPGAGVSERADVEEAGPGGERCRTPAPSCCGFVEDERALVMAPTDSTVVAPSSDEMLADRKRSWGPSDV